MGFRNKRRSRGGGHHHHHHTHAFGGGEPNGLQPGDDVGNRKSLKPIHIPPEDLGNRKDPEEEEWVPDDDSGNRIDAVPTHELSGILLELDGKRRRRRPKGVAAPERVGRYFVGGVNPLIATNIPRPFFGKTLDESLHTAAAAEPRHTNGHAPGVLHPVVEAQAVDGSEADLEGDGGRRRRKRGRGRDQVDLAAAQDVSERRAQRFFDFEDDDRFDYTLKSDPELKRADAETMVRAIVLQAGREAHVVAKLLEDGARPKILVVIEERGPVASLGAERRAPHAEEPLFIMGSAALMSLNYLVNKIVNRYPDDRIRLAVLPSSGERLYLDALAEHRRARGDNVASREAHIPTSAAVTGPPAALSPSPTAGHDVPLAVVEVPQVAVKPLVVVTPAPVGVAAPEEAFDEPTSPPQQLAAPTHVIPASAHAEARAEARASLATGSTGDGSSHAELEGDGAGGEETVQEDNAEEGDNGPRRGRPRRSAPRKTPGKATARDTGKTTARDAGKASRGEKAKSVTPTETPARSRATKKAPAVEKVVVRAPRKP